MLQNRPYVEHYTCKSFVIYHKTIHIRISHYLHALYVHCIWELSLYMHQRKILEILWNLVHVSRSYITNYDDMLKSAADNTRAFTWLSLHSLRHLYLRFFLRVFYISHIHVLKKTTKLFILNNNLFFNR